MKNVGTIFCIWNYIDANDPFIGETRGTYRVDFFTGMNIVIPSIYAVVDNFGDLVEVRA